MARYPKPTSNPICSKPAATVRSWVVTAAAGSTLREVDLRLKSLGFIPESTLDAIGLIIGRCPEDRLERLRSLPCVAAVEAESTMSAI